MYFIEISIRRNRLNDIILLCETKTVPIHVSPPGYLCVKLNGEFLWCMLVIFYFINFNPRVLKMLLIYIYSVHVNIIFKENNFEYLRVYSFAFRI